MIRLSALQPPGVMTSDEDMAGERSQLSDAVAVPVAAGKVLAPQETVVFPGHVIVGARLSSITIVCTHVLELPQSSVAVQVREMVDS